MRIVLLLLVLLGPGAWAAPPAPAEPVSRIAFGSCNKHDLPQPLWRPILAWGVQLWIWLGDNVYGDTEDMAELRMKYAAQKSQPDYARVREGAHVVGTWDDHDYGVNNGGRDYPGRVASQEVLLDFLDEPADSDRRRREGVYASHVFGPEGRQVCVVLLDVRYHRDAPGTDGDILGEAQWAWLERTLRGSQAQVHLLCSGTQFLPTEHRFEKWADYPRARERLLRLLEETRPSGLVLLSGDRHIGEISTERLGSLALWEITSSGMTHFYRNFPGEVNSRRAGAVLAQLHYGTVEIDWARGSMTLALRDEAGRAVERQEVSWR